MSYDSHVATAFRYAALALSQPPARDEDQQLLRQHFRDTAVLLYETGHAATRSQRLSEPRYGVAALGHNPVKALLSRLYSIGHPRIRTPHLLPPSERWAGRPESPGAVTSPADAWLGVLTELLQARRELGAAGPYLDSPRAWSVLGDVAALSETLSISLVDNIRAEPHHLAPHSIVIRHSLALGVDAREAAHLARNTTHTTRPLDTIDPDRTPRVVTVPSSERLHSAAVNLTHLLHVEEPSAPDVLAVTRVLAQTSRAAATALHAATPLSPIPEHLNTAATALAQHADHLAAAVTTYQTRLGSITPGAPLLIAQAREIGAVALPGLRSLSERPTAAAPASPHLLHYADVLPELTEELKHTIGGMAENGQIMIRDRSDGGPDVGWRHARAGDLAALTQQYTLAAAAARTAPPTIRDTVTPTLPRSGIAARGAHAELAAALGRRRDAIRPARPMHALYPDLQVTRLR